MSKQVQTIINKAKNLGWSVEDEGESQYRFSKYSPAGQDFGISVEGESAEELINSIDEAHENYDVSTETYLWLDNAGHGTNGAPYHMKDVLKDMEACEQMILDLYNKISQD